MKYNLKPKFVEALKLCQPESLFKELNHNHTSYGILFTINYKYCVLVCHMQYIIFSLII